MRREREEFGTIGTAWHHAHQSRQLAALADPERRRVLTVVLSAGSVGTDAASVGRASGMCGCVAGRHIAVLADVGLIHRSCPGAAGVLRANEQAFDAIAAILAAKRPQVGGDPTP